MGGIKGNDNPTPVEWEEEPDYDLFLDEIVKNHYAACPTCHEWPLYGENPCPYCGQALIVEYPEGAKPEKVESELTGVTKNSDGLNVCDNCGGMEFEIISHIDAKDFYGTDYKCCKCGSKVTVTVKRSHGGEWIF